jgi:hypothetical protein
MDTSECGICGFAGRRIRRKRPPGLRAERRYQNVLPERSMPGGRVSGDGVEGCIWGRGTNRLDRFCARGGGGISICTRGI